jgi:alpha-soluble NSF attachment protein
MSLIFAPCSLANKHYLKAADLAALESDYYKAIEHYERIGRSSINNGLMKWSVKDYLLKAGLCHLATQVRYLHIIYYVSAH